jgi:Flp pilus assembly protein TadD
VRVLQFRGSILWPIVTLVVAFVLHVQALVFLPALVYVVAWRLSRDPTVVVERRLPAVLAILMTAGVGLAWLTPLRRYLLHWIPQGDEQAVLDLGHSIDMLNEILLVFPAALFFVALFFLVKRSQGWMRVQPAVAAAVPPPPSGKPRRAGRGQRRKQATAVPASASAAPAAWLQTRAEWHFFLLIAWGCVLYLLFFAAEIGVARDWDLFAMIAVGLLPLGLILWNRFESTVGGFDLFAHAPVVAPAVALTLVMGMSWVLLNHSMPHATRRFEGILSWETAKVPYGLEALAATYSDAGNTGEAVRIMQKAVEISPNKRLRALLGTYHYTNGEYDKARVILSEELQRTPEDDRLRTWLLRTLHAQGDFETQVALLREGVQTNPDNLRFHLLLGELLLQRGQIEEGLQHLRIGSQKEMPAAARAHVESLIRKYEQAGSGSQPR